jgi:hypothetical protein
VDAVVFFFDTLLLTNLTNLIIVVFHISFNATAPTPTMCQYPTCLMTCLSCTPLSLLRCGGGGTSGGSGDDATPRRRSVPEAYRSVTRPRQHQPIVVFFFFVFFLEVANTVPSGGQWAPPVAAVA